MIYSFFFPFSSVRTEVASATPPCASLPQLQPVVPSLRLAGRADPGHHARLVENPTGHQKRRQRCFSGSRNLPRGPWEKGDQLPDSGLKWSVKTITQLDHQCKRYGNGRRHRSTKKKQLCVNGAFCNARIALSTSGNCSSNMKNVYVFGGQFYTAVTILVEHILDSSQYAGRVTKLRGHQKGYQHHLFGSKCLSQGPQ